MNLSTEAVCRDRLAPIDRARYAVGPLQDLTDPNREELVRLGQITPFEEGEVLVRQGTPQNTLYVVLEGSLQVRCSSPYSIIDLAILGRGESFGEMGLLDPMKASASVFGKQAGSTWNISRDQLERFARIHPFSGMALFRCLGVSLTRRMRKSEDRLIRCSERPIGFDNDY